MGSYGAMDLDAIPGLSDEVNSEMHSMNEEFTGHQSEEEDASGASCAFMDLDMSVEDREEESLVREYFGNPCCSLGPKKGPCWTHAGKERFLLARQESLDLEKKELDLVVLANLRASRSLTPDSSASQEGTRASIKYQYGGLVICKSAFLFIHAIGSRRLKNLISHYDENGLSIRMHGNAKKRRHNQTETEEVEKIKGFIEQFADNHAMPLPGRMPTHKDYRVMLLPSDMSKSAVYRFYVRACESEHVHCVCRRTFENIWKELCPYIAAMKPATDLCHTCQQNANLLMKSVNVPEELKSQRLQEAQKHLHLARLQRHHYNEQCALAKENLASNSLSVMHYSFDYAQQVHYPFNAQQPGPIFFKTPRKCGIFGVSCEATSSQMNYLIDEADGIGKGANATISLIHHYLQSHGLKERHLLLHADNCVGQNKNNMLIQYLVWRTLAGLNDTVELSFMLVGHTKFAPDRFFGLFKRLYRWSQVDTITDIVRVVKESSPSGKNLSQLTVSPTGSREVHWIDWLTFFQSFFKPIPNITSYHHFKMSKADPGIVTVKEYANSPEIDVRVFKKDIIPSSFRGQQPTKIVPTGLDSKRQWYLYDEIRPFCSNNLAKDMTCPKPSVPRPQTATQQEKQRKKT